MKAREKLDNSYLEAIQLLSNGDQQGATSLLHSNLLAHPRAAQTLFLFGVSHILSGNEDFGLDCVERAYEIKPWITDDLIAIPGAMEKIKSLETDNAFGKEWIEYSELRHYPLNFGLGYHTVIDILLEGREFLSLVEVGANDGRSADPIYKYVLDGRLQGLLIEPMPDPFERLKETYKGTTGNTFLNLGVGREDGEIELFFSERSTLTTANPKKNALKDLADLEKTVVAVRSLVNILDEHGLSKFDVLQIDTEGYEWEILCDFPLDEYDISVIYIEFYCLSITERIALFRRLDAAGYSYHYDGVNLIAVDPKKFPQLKFGHRT